MRNRNVLGYVLTVITASVAIGVSAADRPQGPSVQARYPSLLLDVLCNNPGDECNRFGDPAYFGLLAADQLLLADPQSLFQIIKTAADAHESYKALLFARIFTERRPDLAAGWSNRSAFAEALGLHDEAAAAQAKAQNPGDPKARVVGTFLPGATVAKPVSLADFAAAVAMMADDVARRGGDNHLMAVSSDISGAYVASPPVLNAIHQWDTANRDAGHPNPPPVAPYAAGAPIKIEHILTNGFLLTAAEPMKRAGGMGVMSTLGMVAVAGAAGYGNYNGQTAAASQLSSNYAELLGRAMQTPSLYKGGSYAAVRFAGVTPKPESRKPRPSGESDALGLPIILPWASGAFGTANAIVRVRSDTDTITLIVPDDASLAARTKQRTPNGSIDLKDHTHGLVQGGHVLLFTKDAKDRLFLLPKLSRLSTQRGNMKSYSPPVTLQELLLTGDDVRLLGHSLGGRLPPNLDSWRQLYATDPLAITIGELPVGDYEYDGHLYPGTFVNDYVLFDEANRSFRVRQGPTDWITPATDGWQQTKALKP